MTSKNTWRRSASAAIAALMVLTSAGCERSLEARGSASKYTLDDWMSVTSVGSFRWAPDGQHFYYTSDDADSGTREIFRVSVDGSGATQLSSNPAGTRPEPKGGLVLSPDGQTIYFTSARSFQGYDNIWAMPSEGGEAVPITFNDAVIQTAPDISPDGRTLSYFARTSRGTRIFLVGLEGEGPSWSRLLEFEDRQERSPAFSPDGRNLAFARGGGIWVRPLDGADESRNVVPTEYAPGTGFAAWSPDGRRIAVTNSMSGHAQVGVLELASGELTPITYAERDHGSVSWSPDGRWILFTRSDEVGMANEVVLARSDGSGEERVLATGQAMRNGPRFSPDGRWVAYIESTTTRTRDIWKVPAAGGEPVQVTNSMGRIDPADLREAAEVFYPGPDNLAIPSLLYRPKDFDPSRRYPVIVRLHGHPGQWNHSFEMERQYFVEQGFVVVAPNPRGSRGFGQGFHDLHIGDYGGTEMQDILHVLPFLDDLGYVDMNRKATWGGSGGGYQSFMLSTMAPDAFEAQVIRAPVSDWELLAIDRFGASGRAWTATRTPVRERSEFGGPPDEIPEEYHDRSPINFVENVTVPQLLFQGLRDRSVPPRQSTVWVDRMQELGKAHLLTYVEYPDEDHGLRRYRATVRDRIERMEDFLGTHLGLSHLGTP